MEILLNGVNRNKIAAVIDLGSSKIKMKISQLSKGKISDLEILEYPVNIGHEVFSKNKISFESIVETSEILNGYVKVLEEYGITQYKAIATTAVRESENCEFMADQLKIKSGINIDIIESNYEKTLIYFHIMNKIKNMDLPNDKDTLIVYIGTGSIGIALCRGNKMVFSHSLSIGYVKLQDIFANVIESDINIRTAVEEYLDKIFYGLRLWLNKDEKLNLIITGDESDIILKSLRREKNQDGNIVEAKEIKEFYESLNIKDTKIIALENELSYKEVKCIRRILAIYMCILKIVKINEIRLMKVDLSDAVMEQMLFPIVKKELENNIIENAVFSAKQIAEYYKLDKKHYEEIEMYASIIFDRLKKFHGLNKREKLLLQIACILSECGSSINSQVPLDNVFNTIKNCNIYGLNYEENLIIACIASHNELITTRYQNELYNKLTVRNKLLISKLTAIYLVANALDDSHKQKLSQIKVRVSKDEVIVSGLSKGNMLLEKWALDNCNSYFEEIFGLRIRLLTRPENLLI